MTSFDLFAKQAPKRKVASTDQSIKAMTIYGETVSNFIIDSTNEKYSIAMSNNTGANYKRTLTKADFDYILKEYFNLPKAAKIPSDCYRARIDIVLYNKSGLQDSKKSSCFGLKTVTEPHYVRFSKILLQAL
jgi:hypothetical protein